jgi:hypothetical protein
MTVIPFPRRQHTELGDLGEELRGRLESWTHLLRLGASPANVLAEMAHFLERRKQSEGA